MIKIKALFETKTEYQHFKSISRIDKFYFDSENKKYVVIFETNADITEVVFYPIKKQENLI